MNQTHEGDRLEVYACEPAGNQNENAAAAYTEAYIIELDGKQVVSCQVTR